MSTEAPQSPKHDFDTPSHSTIGEIVHGDDYKRSKIGRRGMMVAAGSILTGIVAGGGIFMATAEKATEPQPAPSATSNETPGQQPSANPTGEVSPSASPSPSSIDVLYGQELVDINKLPVDTVESAIFTTLTPEQQATITYMDSMSVEEFRTLPAEQQMMFAQYVYDNNAPRVINSLKRNGFEYEEYANRLAETKVAPTNTAQEVMDSNAIFDDVAGNLYSEGNRYDAESARKMMSLLVAPGHGINDKLDAYYSNKPIGLEISTTTDIAASKSYVEKGLTHMKINAVIDGIAAQTTYRYVTFQDVRGNERGAWQAVMSVIPGDPRYDTTVQ